MADARVRAPNHPGTLEATLPVTLANSGAKPGVSRKDCTGRQSSERVIRKRALHRAIGRADRNPNGTTWYRGRRLTAGQLRSGVPAASPTPLEGTNPPATRGQRRLRIISWNAGGLSGPRYNEVLEWLGAEAKAGRPVDLCLLQETSWRQDMEYTSTPSSPEAPTYHVIHSAGADKSGVLCMIRVGLVPAGHIRSVARLPGRVLHVRLLFEVPLDILVVYQFAWNPHKQSLQGNKCEALMKQRRRVWKLTDQGLRSVPHRNGCMLAGDFNVPIATERPIAGDGTTSASGQQQDQTAFQEVLRTHNCCVLNTWTGRGPAARTYIPPQQDGQGLGTQIDFFIVRGHLADDVAKRAGPFDVLQDVDSSASDSGHGSP